MEVKRHGKILRLLLIENFKQNIQESIYGVRVQSFCIGQIRYAVKTPGSEYCVRPVIRFYHS